MIRRSRPSRRRIAMMVGANRVETTSVWRKTATISSSPMACRCCIDTLLRCGTVPLLCEEMGQGIGVVHRQEPRLRVCGLPRGRLLRAAQKMDVPAEGVAHVAAGGCRRRHDDGDDGGGRIDALDGLWG